MPIVLLSLSLGTGKRGIVRVRLRTIYSKESNAVLRIGGCVVTRASVVVLGYLTYKAT